MSARILKDSFFTSEENMRFDDSLVSDWSKGSRIFRLYDWQQVGITYSYKQTIPSALRHFSHAQRATGGGIVFHSPGDLVFSVVGSNTDPFFPKRAKSLLGRLSHHIRTALLQQHIPISTSDEEEGSRQTDFCKHYATPFELSIEKDKVVAITLRKYKDVFLIQGIIHLNSNRTLFGHLSEFQSFLTDGIHHYFRVDAKKLREDLQSIFTNSSNF